MKDHHSYGKTYMGESDIAMLIVETCSKDGIQLEKLLMGGDGDYKAYVVDDECTIPDSYELVISHDGEGWMRVYDDSECVGNGGFGQGVRIYRRGDYGIIIQLL